MYIQNKISFLSYLHTLGFINDLKSTAQNLLDICFFEVHKTLVEKFIVFNHSFVAKYANPDSIT